MWLASVFLKGEEGKPVDRSYIEVDLSSFIKKGFPGTRNPWRWWWTLFLELLKYSQGTCNCVRIPELLYFPLHPLCQMEWDWASTATEKEFGSLFPEPDAQRVHGTVRWLEVRDGNSVSPCPLPTHSRYSKWSQDSLLLRKNNLRILLNTICCRY